MKIPRRLGHETKWSFLGRCVRKEYLVSLVYVSLPRDVLTIFILSGMVNRHMWYGMVWQPPGSKPIARAK